jgi:hypothetical protein
VGCSLGFLHLVYRLVWLLVGLLGWVFLGFDFGF